MDKASRAYRGSYERVVHLPAISYHRYVDESQVSLPPRGCEAIPLHQESQASVEFFTFDQGHVERLRAGDPSTERHFVDYFEQLLLIKLRSRTRPSDTVEDLQQDTCIRVTAAVR